MRFRRERADFEFLREQYRRSVASGTRGLRFWHGEAMRMQGERDRARVALRAIDRAATRTFGDPIDVDDFDRAYQLVREELKS